MKMPRFAALVANAHPDVDHARTGLRESFASAGPEITLLDKGPLFLAVTRDGALDLAEVGVIVGSLFDRRSMQRVMAIGPVERQRIASEGPGGLVRRYWGAYVAFLIGGDGAVAVLRAPLGELPCIHAKSNRGIVVASDIVMASLAGISPPGIAWDRVRHELVTRGLLWPQTCLDGVSDLTGGSCLTIGRSTAITEVWSPWAFVAQSAWIIDPSEAVARVGTEARACVEARASQFDKVLLMLSGGIDSSIVAACLSSSDTQATALTLVTRDAIGDERHYARRVAKHLGIPLVEPFRDVERIDVTRSSSALLCRPSQSLFMQESIRLSEEHAAASGATAIFTGAGGDNVFCALQSSSPAADRLRTSGLSREFLQTSFEISRLAPASLWQVMIDAVRRAWLGKAPLTPFRDTSLLCAEACRGIQNDDTHPWLDVPKGALPGSAAFVRLIASARSYVETVDPLRPFWRTAPLMAQPLVETCLRVPSWLWLENGRSRVIARKAFAPVLPPEVMKRRSKGTPDGFIAEIFEHHRETIRDFLADGALVAHGIVERRALLGVLDRPGPTRGMDYDRVLRLVDMEAWIQARL